MRIAKRTRISRFLLLVSVSGAGLVAFGGLSLRQALIDSEARGQRTASLAATGTARAVREVLRSPGTLDLAPDERRFMVAGGQVTVPVEVGWVQPERERPRLELPPDWRTLLGQLERGIAVPTIPSSTLGERSAEWFALVRAFRAHRDDDAVVAEAQLGLVLSALRRADRKLPPYRSVVAGALILAVTLTGSLPDEAAEWVRILTATETRGLGERLVELGKGAEAERLTTAQGEIETRRHVLRTAAENLAGLLSGAPVQIVPVGAEVLLFHRSVESAEVGVGAVVDVAHLLQVIRGRAAELLVVPWSGRPVFGAEMSADAIEIVPGSCGVLPEYTVQDGGFVGSIGLWALLGACSLCFIGGLFATVRVMTREAAAVRSRADFLTSVTHELKTPLASIRLLAERLHEGRVRDDDRQQEYFGLLAGESSRLTVLIENVLDLGRIERGERSYDRRPAQLRSVVAEGIDVVEPLMRADGFEVTRDLDGLDVDVVVDRGAIVQALVNVLDNARKYASQGKLVAVRSSVEGGRATVEIRDHGPGVDAEQRERIFVRFERGVEQRDGSVPGVGLGLYLARSILRAHGGDLVCVAPETGSGAVFVLTLPVKGAAS